MKTTRTPFLVVNKEKSPRKDVYGSIDDSVVRQAQLIRTDEDSRTAFVGMHPIGSPAYLPAFSHLARLGLHVVAGGTRYTTGDAGLQMENALLDLAALIRETKERLGYERVVLVGWSGGGSLIAAYQAEAEHKTITHTAAGEPSVIADTEFLRADGVVLMASHRSRHHLLTDFLDPSIQDEDRPDERDPELNIYDPANPNKPPYSPEFVQKYRLAQLDRNRRITARVRERYDRMQSTGRPHDEYCFVVHGTMADLRWLDPAIDPNDRVPGWSYLGDPRIANDASSGLARFCTTRGWLSQWSIDDAQVDAIDAAPRITVPVLVVTNSADDACPASHQRDFFERVASESKVSAVIKGANHYFSGDGEQRQYLDEAVESVLAWGTDNDLLI
ncbi:alpha/beta fold hydrolase [Mycobacterium saskatchewanense]|uniref:Alpha/beta hydrolase n=1 Tax=Mycobacterium saskatchewanense TaxID=220927 RepID=A0AAJ3TVZ4_9MYCO|nr:alpha/beta fold hydrolase [Mycobacterium saskatchewanense]ORW72915.1 alpha/beta hydrolase [Mycobacterium saskatchewanense]